MAYVILDTKEISEVLDRLNSNALNTDDTRLIGLLLKRAQQIADFQVSQGRLSVNQLPVGFDLVK